ncbi:unnamed protein product, partial [Brassica oleracea]
MNEQELNARNITMNHAQWRRWRWSHGGDGGGYAVEAVLSSSSVSCSQLVAAVSFVVTNRFSTGPRLKDIATMVNYILFEHPILIGSQNSSDQHTPPHISISTPDPGSHDSFSLDYCLRTESKHNLLPIEAERSGFRYIAFATTTTERSFETELKLV